MEHKIGEIFEYNGEWYQCVKSDGTCNGCVGKFQPYSFCNGFKECVGKIFKKLEKFGEPYEHYEKFYQCYKLPMKTEIRLLPDNCYPIGKDNLVEIEIKQKEDMEGKKLNLKPFSLEAAKAGKPVCTRDGRKARIICFDLKNEEYPIVAAIGNDSSETLLCYTLNGEIVKGNYKSDKDIMMLSEKKEGWVNVYKDGLLGARVHNTKKEAFDNASPKDYVATVKIEWEE